MTEQALDNLTRRILLDLIRIELNETVCEDVTFVPSQYHREQMRIMLEDPIAWARSKQGIPF